MFSLLKCTFLCFCFFIEINGFEISNKWQNVIDSTLAISKANVNYESVLSRDQYNNEKCLNDVIRFYEGIDQSQEWAVKSWSPIF